MKVGDRLVSSKGILMLLEDIGEVILPLTREKLYKMQERPDLFLSRDYFPSVVRRVANRLERSGMVTKKETAEGLVVTVTDKGKKQILRYKLADMRPKSGKWDGKWRVVFFDIGDKHRKKRENMRVFLEQLGFRRYQESVYISPFDCDGEVQYLRELFEVPNEVKMGVLMKIENEEELREIFGV